MIAAVAVGCFALIVLVVWLRSRRQTMRRVRNVVNRLGDRASDVEHAGGGRIDSELSRLERTVDQANERLADAAAERDRLGVVLRSVEDGVIVADASGRIVHRNATAERYVDARHGDAIVEDAVDDVMAATLRGQPMVRDVLLFGPPRRSLEVRGIPLEELGGAAVFVRDVSTARRVDTVRRDFVANVSHELKTPIGALIALAETLVDDDDIEVVRRLTQRVLQEARRLSRIIDDLLDLSVIEAQESPEREPVPVAHLVEDAVDRVRGAAESAGVAVEVVEPVPDDLIVHCDRRQIVSALFNLLDNAVKYSDRLANDRPTVEVGAHTDGDRVSVWVRDHGVGIPSSDLERIFERFYRVDRARSRESGGTGLGLSIVRHIAQAHGGEVLVESTEGDGSTFFLVLALGRSAADPPVAEASV